MAYNKKLLYVSEAPVWITEAGSFGEFNQIGSAIANINLSATEFFNDVITYSITSGSLPTGLSLNSSTGVISGTISGYTGAETVEISITATDSEGETAVRDFSFFINPKYSVDYLVVAGGGGGGGWGGGGGAGGFISGSEFFTPGASLSVTVGSGGAEGVSDGGYQPGGNGSDSSIFSSGILNINSIGGGGGGYFPGNPGLNGGSGGGGGIDGSSTIQGGLGTSGQGNNGGAQFGTSTAPYAGGGGGGGAGQVGNSNQTSGFYYGGNGGNGLQSSITGTPTYYAGGGGGHTDGRTVNSPSVSQGGLGGGGNGGRYDGASGPANAQDGQNFTGGGGGGSFGGTHSSGAAFCGAGGSGVVILRMPTASYSGTITGSPTVTTDGSDTILTYTGSGTYTA